MEAQKLQDVLRLHKMWLNNEDKGERANLREANLSGANLSGANLSGANLSGANLRGADLRWAKGIYIFGPMPTSGRMIYAVKHDDGWIVQAGCFWGTLDEMETKVNASHKCHMYLGVINLLRSLQ